MAMNAHIDDATVNADYDILATITYADAATGYSRQVTLSIDPNLTLAQIQTAILREGIKHKAISAKRLAYLNISSNGTTKPYVTYVGQDVAVP